MPPRALSHAVVAFGALLRRHSLPLTPLQITDAVRALDHLDLGDRDEVQRGLSSGAMIP